MQRINQFGVEPGLYTINGQKIVVTNIVTHSFVDGNMVELQDPKIIYRDLETNINQHISYEMPLSDFKQRKG